MLKDWQFQKDFYKFDYHCQACGECFHLLKDCPYVQYCPKKISLVQLQNSLKNERQLHTRYHKSKQFNSLQTKANIQHRFFNFAVEQDDVLVEYEQKFLYNYVNINTEYNLTDYVAGDENFENEDNLAEYTGTQFEEEQKLQPYVNPNTNISANSSFQRRVTSKTQSVISQNNPNNLSDCSIKIKPQERKLSNSAIPNVEEEDESIDSNERNQYLQQKTLKTQNTVQTNKIYQNNYYQNMYENPNISYTNSQSYKNWTMRSPSTKQYPQSSLVSSEELGQFFNKNYTKSSIQSSTNNNYQMQWSSNIINQTNQNLNNQNNNNFVEPSINQINQYIKKNTLTRHSKNQANTNKFNTFQTQSTNNQNLGTILNQFNTNLFSNHPTQTGYVTNFRQYIMWDIDSIQNFKYYKPINNFSFIMKNNLFEKFKTQIYQMLEEEQQLNVSNNILYNAKQASPINKKLYYSQQNLKPYNNINYTLDSNSNKIILQRSQQLYNHNPIMSGSNIKSRNSLSNSNNYANTHQLNLGSGILQLKKVDSLKYSKPGSSPKKKKKYSKNKLNKNRNKGFQSANALLSYNKNNQFTQ